MSNKTTLQSLSDANIADASSILASEHRAVNDAFLDNFYADALHELHSASVITAQTADLNFYDLYFCKQGRVVTVTGVLVNKQTVISSSTSFFEVVDSEFMPLTAGITTQKIFGQASNDFRNIRLVFNSSNELVLSGSSLGVGQNVYVTFQYLTQD